jgi:chaperonin cofactor prefoldin
MILYEELIRNVYRVGPKTEFEEQLLGALTALVDETEGNEKELRDAENAFEDLTEKYEELEIRCESLESELDDALAEIQELKAELAEARDD